MSCRIETNNVVEIPWLILLKRWWAQVIIMGVASPKVGVVSKNFLRAMRALMSQPPYIKFPPLNIDHPNLPILGHGKGQRLFASKGASHSNTLKECAVLYNITRLLYIST